MLQNNKKSKYQCTIGKLIERLNRHTSESDCVREISVNIRKTTLSSDFSLHNNQTLPETKENIKQGLQINT